MELEQRRSRRRFGQRDRASRADRPIEADVDLRLPERGITSWIGRGRGAVAGTMILLFLVSQLGKVPVVEPTLPASQEELSSSVPGSLRKEESRRGIAADETPLERIERIGGRLATGFTAEQKAQMRFRVSNKATAHTGLNSDGSIYATRTLLDTIRVDEQLAPLLAVELAYEQALRDSVVARASQVSIDQLLETAASHLEQGKFPLSMMVVMAEWLTKQTTLATLQPAPDLNSMRLRIQNVLQARQVPSQEGTPR
jgi:hypothetical protein